MTDREEYYDAADDAQAQSALTAMQSWASPRVGLPAAGGVASASFSYERSPMDWMKRTLEHGGGENDDDDYKDDDEDEALDMERDSFMDEDEFDNIDDDDDDQGEALRQAPASARAARLATPRVLQRADTPVMSNASKKTNPVATTPGSPAVNVQSPFVPAIYTTTPATTTTTRRVEVLPHATPLSRTYVQECRLYHDALRIFRQDKMRLLERTDRAAGGGGGGGINVIAAQEDRLDQDFLQGLQNACYSRTTAPLPSYDPIVTNPMKTPARKEGNFWSLLSHLRRLGVAGVLYNNATDNREITRQFLSQQAQRVHATPLELSRSMVKGPQAPLCIQRWSVFLSWLEECHNRVLPANIARPRPGTSSFGNNATNTNSNDVTVDGCLPAAEQRKTEVLKAALNLVLAGRLQDAIDMAAKSDLEYLAAQWSGGTPAGKDGNQMMGNTRRPLWQALMWKKAELLEDKTTTTTREDTALAALLSNNVIISLQHPCLLTWERALYAMARAVVGRWQDEMWFEHNQHRRQARPPYPGTQWEMYEKNNLQNTANVQDMTEGNMITHISSTPFAEMKDEDPYSTAMTAFWVGKSAVQSYMKDWSIALMENDEDYVRFMAHLALYLDSLTLGGSPQNLPGVEQWMNGCVKRYLDLLASREELWQMVVLYAAFLPKSDVMSTLPILLLPVDSQPTRKELLRQMEEFLEPGLDREILLAVARLTLEDIEVTEDLLRPTALDQKKMRVVLWFSLRHDLVSDGLVYANTLLRQFLLYDKVVSAYHFISDVRPVEIAEFFEEGNRVVHEDTRLPVDADGSALMTIGNDPTDEHIKEARREHAALLAYLHAGQVVDYWKGVIGHSEAAPAEVDDPIDKSVLNKVEALVAQSEERRKLAEEKQSTSHKVAFAAKDALVQLDAVLKFGGGWLLVEERENEFPTDQEKTHWEELDQLRSKIIPSIIRQYREICMVTAEWMSKSLYDGVKRLKKDAVAVLSDLDRSNPTETSALAPSYWTKQALGMVDAITTETYLCLPALTATSRREILALMAETMVAHLEYESELA